MAIFRLEIKTKNKSTAMPHYNYINREGKYKNKEDLEYKKEFNVPENFKNGKDFFKIATENERKNGIVNYSLTITLPLEFSKIENEKLIENFCKKEFENHVYMIAIHNPNGKNPHAHILLNERKLDGIERRKENFFKRANTKNPKLGGAIKDSRINSKFFFKEIRKSWEAHLNEKLQEKGFEKVSCESNYHQILEKLTKDENNKNLSQEDLKKLAKEELKKQGKGLNKKEIKKELFELNKMELKNKLLEYQIKSYELSNEIRTIDNRLKSLDEMSVNIYTKGNLKKQYSNEIKKLQKQISQDKKSGKSIFSKEEKLEKLKLEKQNFIDKYKNNIHVQKIKKDMEEKYIKQKTEKQNQRSSYNMQIRNLVKKSSLKELKEVSKNLNSLKESKGLKTKIDSEIKKIEVKREIKKQKVKTNIKRASRDIYKKISSIRNIGKKDNAKEGGFNIRDKHIKEEKTDELER